MSNYYLKFAERNVALPAPIKQKVEIGELTVVRLYPSDDMLNSYPQEKLNRNVYAFNTSGELMWQIQEAPDGGVGEDKAYMNIKLESDKLIVGNWIGADYVVDLSTGGVVQVKNNIRPW